MKHQKQLFKYISEIMRYDYMWINVHTIKRDISKHYKAKASWQSIKHALDILVIMNIIDIHKRGFRTYYKWSVVPITTLEQYSKQNEAIQRLREIILQRAGRR